MYAGLSKAQKEEAQAIFNYLDRGQKGYLTADDMREALEAFKLDTGSIEEMMLEAGAGEKITLAGFITIIGHRIQAFDSAEDVQEALEPFTLAGGEEVCLSELKLAMTTGPEGLKEEEWDRLMSEVRGDRIGTRDLVRLLTVRE